MSLEMGIQMAFVPDPADIELAKKGAHDMLIKLWGASRRSGIRWDVFTGIEEIAPMIHRAREAHVPIDPYMVQLIVKNPNGLLAVAYAEVEVVRA